MSRERKPNNCLSRTNIERVASTKPGRQRSFAALRRPAVHSRSLLPVKCVWIQLRPAVSKVKAATTRLYDLSYDDHSSSYARCCSVSDGRRPRAGAGVQSSFTPDPQHGCRIIPVRTAEPRLHPARHAGSRAAGRELRSPACCGGSARTFDAHGVHIAVYTWVFPLRSWVLPSTGFRGFSETMFLRMPSHGFIQSRRL